MIARTTYFGERILTANDLYDRAEALGRLGDDEELFASVAELFIADSEGYCQALESALAAGDAPGLQREAHTVKSMLATFSCETGRERAMRLEYLAGSGSLDGAASLTQEVIAALRLLAAALANEKG